MSKKKVDKKDLQKRLNSVMDVFIDQTGKENKKLLKAYIKNKIREIFLFQETLTKKGKIKANQNNLEAPNIPHVQPSALLVDKLHNQDINSNHPLP